MRAKKIADQLLNFQSNPSIKTVLSSVGAIQNYVTAAEIVFNDFNEFSANDGVEWGTKFLIF